MRASAAQRENKVFEDGISLVYKSHILFHHSPLSGGLWRAAKNTELSQWESLLQYAKDSVRAHLKSCREQVSLAAPSPLEKHFLRWWEIKPCLKSTTFQIPVVVKSKYPVWILLQTSWSRYPRALSRESKAQSGAVWLHINVSKTVERLDAPLMVSIIPHNSLKIC